MFNRDEIDPYRRSRYNQDIASDSAHQNRTNTVFIVCK